MSSCNSRIPALARIQDENIVGDVELLKSSKYRNSTVEIHNDDVLKTLPHGFNADLVFEKHRKIHEISRNHDFETPEVKNIVGEVLHIQRVDLPQTLVQLVRSAIHEKKNIDLCLEAIAEAGRVLACIHENLLLESFSVSDITCRYQPDMQSIRPDVVCDIDANKVFFHSDFTLNNLFYGGETLTVLDPLPNYHTTHFINEKGSRYLELALFLNSIHQQIGYKGFFSHDSYVVSKIAMSFILAYESRIDEELDIERALVLSYAIDNVICRLRVNGKLAQMLRMATTRRAVLRGLQRMKRVVS